MKAWKKGAVVGAVWGVISGIQWLAVLMGAQPSFLHMIVFFPATLSFVVLNKLPLSFLPGLMQLLFFLISPIIIGALIGYVIGRCRTRRFDAINGGVKNEI